MAQPGMGWLTRKKVRPSRASANAKGNASITAAATDVAILETIALANSLEAYLNGSHRFTVRPLGALLINSAPYPHPNFAVVNCLKKTEVSD